MHSINNYKSWPSHVKLEYGYAKGRQILLSIVAIGSVLALFRIGGLVAAMVNAGPTLTMIIKNFFVLAGLLGIDWNVLNSLSAASNRGAKKRSVWVLAICSLLVTLGLSLVSNLFISDEASGETFLDDHNEAILSAARQDSTLKAQTLTLLQSAGTEERRRIREAQQTARDLLREAVNSGSASWRSDYEAHKNNPKAWFWTCTSCPREYRAYRRRIQDAKTEGQGLIAQAQGYLESVQSSVAPTLSYQIQEDTTLAQMGKNFLMMEEMRHQRAALINWVLLAVTLGGALLSIILTIVLKSHREEYGQHIHEDHIGPLLLAFDLLGRVGQGAADIVYNVIFRPLDAARRHRVLQPYVGSNSSGFLVAQDSNSQQAEETNTHNQQEEEPTTNDSQANKPTAKSQQQAKPNKKPCTGPKCERKPSANQAAGSNRRRLSDIEDLDKFIERYRMRWKRQYTSSTERARANNRRLAAEDEQLLKELGARIEKDRAGGKVSVIMPKK